MVTPLSLKGKYFVIFRVLDWPLKADRPLKQRFVVMETWIFSWHAIELISVQFRRRRFRPEKEKKKRKKKK